MPSSPLLRNGSLPRSPLQPFSSKNIARSLLGNQALDSPTALAALAARHSLGGPHSGRGAHTVRRAIARATGTETESELVVEVRVSIVLGHVCPTCHKVLPEKVPARPRRWALPRAACLPCRPSRDSPGRGSGDARANLVATTGTTSPSGCGTRDLRRRRGADPGYEPAPLCGRHDRGIVRALASTAAPAARPPGSAAR